MKIEYLDQSRKKHSLTLRERHYAYLPRYAPAASRLAPLLNLRDRVPGLAWVSEMLTGLSARRALPVWHLQPYREAPPGPTAKGREVVLLVDTFNRWFEPENARAAERVLGCAGYAVLTATQPGERPLCCGRTFLAAGLVEEAKLEARRLLAALKPYVARGLPVVGL